MLNLALIVGWLCLVYKAVHPADATQLITDGDERAVFVLSLVALLPLTAVSSELASRRFGHVPAGGYFVEVLVALVCGLSM